jgi:hypothetical protein
MGSRTWTRTRNLPVTGFSRRASSLTPGGVIPLVSHSICPPDTSPRLGNVSETATTDPSE